MEISSDESGKDIELTKRRRKSRVQASKQANTIHIHLVYGNFSQFYIILPIIIACNIYYSHFRLSFITFYNGTNDKINNNNSSSGIKKNEVNGVQGT